MSGSFDIQRHYQDSLDNVDQAIGDFAEIYEEASSDKRIRIRLSRIITEMRKHLNHIMSFLDRTDQAHANFSKGERTGFNAHDIKPHGRATDKYNAKQIAFLDHLYEETKTTVSSSDEEICDALSIRTQHVDVAKSLLGNAKRIELTNTDNGRIIVRYSPFDQLTLPKSRKLSGAKKAGLLGYLEQHVGELKVYLVDVVTNARNTEEHDTPIEVTIDQVPYLHVSTTDELIWLLRVEAGGTISLSDSLLYLDPAPSANSYPAYIKSVLKFGDGRAGNAHGDKERSLPDDRVRINSKGSLFLGNTAIASDVVSGLLVSPDALIAATNVHVIMGNEDILIKDAQNTDEFLAELNPKSVTLYRLTIAGMDAEDILNHSKFILKVSKAFMDTLPE
jgi:hypothetical protein